MITCVTMAPLLPDLTYSLPELVERCNAVTANAKKAADV
jgi:hypothetical protein